MTTKRFLIAIISVIAISFSATANSMSYVTNDTQNEKGQTVQRMVCEADGNLLTPFRMINFTYNEKGQVTEKKTLKWDSLDKKWMEYELTQYDYSQSPMKVTVLKWDEERKEYKN